MTRTRPRDGRTLLPVGVGRGPSAPRAVAGTTSRPSPLGVGASGPRPWPGASRALGAVGGTTVLSVAVGRGVLRSSVGGRENLSPVGRVPGVSGPWCGGWDNRPVLSPLGWAFSVPRPGGGRTLLSVGVGRGRVRSSAVDRGSSGPWAVGGRTSRSSAPVGRQHPRPWAGAFPVPPTGGWKKLPAFGLRPAAGRGHLNSPSGQGRSLPPSAGGGTHGVRCVPCGLVRLRQPDRAQSPYPGPPGGPTPFRPGRPGSPPFPGQGTEKLSVLARKSRSVRGHTHSPSGA